MTKDTQIKIAAGLTTFVGAALVGAVGGPLVACGAGLTALATWFLGLRHTTPEASADPDKTPVERPTKKH